MISSNCRLAHALPMASSGSGLPRSPSAGTPSAARPASITLRRSRACAVASWPVAGRRCSYSAWVCLLNSIVVANPVLPIIVTAVRSVLCAVPVVAVGPAHGEDPAQAGQQPEYQEHLEDREEKPVPAGKQQRCQQREQHHGQESRAAAAHHPWWRSRVRALGCPRRRGRGLGQVGHELAQLAVGFCVQRRRDPLVQLAGCEPASREVLAQPGGGVLSVYVGGADAVVHRSSSLLLVVLLTALAAGEDLVHLAPGLFQERFGGAYLPG